MKQFSLPLTLLFALILLGCGDKKDKGDDKDDSGGGSGGSLAKKIVGSWELDTDAMMAAVKEQAGDEPGAAEMAQAMLANMKVTVEFKSDGSASMNMAGQAKTGKWKATGESGNTLKLEMTDDAGTPEKMLATFDGDDKVKMGPDGGNAEMEFHLKRTK